MSCISKYQLLFCFLFTITVNAFIFPDGLVWNRSTQCHGIGYETEATVVKFQERSRHNFARHNGKDAMSVLQSNEDGSPSLSVMSEQYLSWDYDILAQSEKNLKDLIRFTFQYYGASNIDELDHIVDAVETEMRDNQYHNFHHVASVVHSSFMMLTLGGADNILNKEEAMVLLLSALMHDIGHPGHNNDYEVKTKSKLAWTYDNQSVLENYSIDCGIQILNTHGKSFTESNFGSGHIDAFESIREAILFTDMSTHNDLTMMLENLVIDRREKASSPMDDSERQLVINCLLHAADISNPGSANFQASMDWGIRIRNEFSSQASKEAAEGLDINPMMNDLDSNEALANFQIGFGKYIGVYFKEIGNLLPGLRCLYENINENTELWESTKHSQ